MAVFKNHYLCNGCRSTIDHFYVSDNLFQYISSCLVRHDGDNLSDHSALVLSVSLPTEHLSEELGTQNKRAKWHLVTDGMIRDYKTQLNGHLSKIRIPEEVTNCHDPSCHKHETVIQQFHNDIVNACVK